MMRRFTGSNLTVPWQGAKVHPSLNSPVEHLVGATLPVLRAQLAEECEKRGIAHCPGKAAISRAMERPGGRGGLPARVGTAKKVENTTAISA